MINLNQFTPFEKLLVRTPLDENECLVRVRAGMSSMGKGLILPPKAERISSRGHVGYVKNNWFIISRSSDHKGYFEPVIHGIIEESSSESLIHISFRPTIGDIFRVGFFMLLVLATGLGSIFSLLVTGLIGSVALGIFKYRLKKAKKYIIALY